MNCIYSNQECNSGCESGWTLYLEHSASISPYNQENHEFIIKNEVAERLYDEEDEDDDEDLSMVSDASSGPPHLHEEEEGYGCFYNYPIIDDPLCKKGKKNRDKKRYRSNAQDRQSSTIDDTASSSLFDSSKKIFSLTKGSQTLVENNELEYSQGYSSTQFEVKPPYQEQYSIFQSTEPVNQQQQNQWFEGKRW